jgi:site-specific DNA recombinase
VRCTGRLHARRDRRVWSRELTSSKSTTSSSVAQRQTEPEKALQRELARARKSLDRYQEDLLSLDELRRLPELRQCVQSLQTELQSILEQTDDRAVHLRLAETLSCFLDRLRTAADTLDVEEHQRIVRLVIKEILVSNETIVILHSIPISAMPSNSDDSPSTLSAEGTPGGLAAVRQASHSPHMYGNRPSVCRLRRFS